MSIDFRWGDPLSLDVQFGYLHSAVASPRTRHPQVVLNSPHEPVLKVLREELIAAREFLFSVAFVTPRAIALLKQEFIDFSGVGRIITSDYLAFNSPAAFRELLSLDKVGIEVRLHGAKAFHPKGYVFVHEGHVTTMVGSSNLTETALVTNHEWNLKVSASADSDLAAQLGRIVDDQVAHSVPLTAAWVDSYAADFVPPPPRVRPHPEAVQEVRLEPNAMQREALQRLSEVRSKGAQRAIIISATGTGKTMLSALDVRQANPGRLLFLAHREQILDRTVQEYRQVLGGPWSDYGKLTGSHKQGGARRVFATVQTISQPEVLAKIDPGAFDYIVIDEAHRAGAASYLRVLEHFRPGFLLGLTATPERMDGLNVFELFDFNVPYEIRLNRALEEEMLCPFHYYGVADVTTMDGRILSGDEDLKVLISPERVDHLVSALETYGLAADVPRGLIFCSRVDEARELATALEGRVVHGNALRALALTGRDSVASREDAVNRLERGELNYLLTVDVFNEGVDIPTVNQIIMLRQTQSSIVFVQQLGRGLRKAPGKECVIVLDFIANYANNHLIPIALFGDESLNKESLKQHMIAAEERGVLPGLASVRFDRVSQQLVLRSIADARLDSMQNIKRALETLRDRLGRVPALLDFLSFESADPVLVATKVRTYPQLVERLLKRPARLSVSELQWLDLLSNEVLNAKRGHEIEILSRALQGPAPLEFLIAACQDAGLTGDEAPVNSAIDTLTVTGFTESDRQRYGAGVASYEAGRLRLHDEVVAAYQGSTAFRKAVDDIVATGRQLIERRYAEGRPFVSGRQYSRRDAARLLCWQRSFASTIYGYRVDRRTQTCAIFVTLHKSADIAESTRYGDKLLDINTLLWFTRSRRTLASNEVKAIVDNLVTLHVFVKKDDAEGSDFFYLGRARAHHPEQTTMPGQVAPCSTWCACCCGSITRSNPGCSTISTPRSLIICSFLRCLAVPLPRRLQKVAGWAHDVRPLGVDAGRRQGVAAGRPARRGQHRPGGGRYGCPADRHGFLPRAGSVDSVRGRDDRAGDRRRRHALALRPLLRPGSVHRPADHRPLVAGRSTRGARAVSAGCRVAGRPG